MSSEGEDLVSVTVEDEEAPLCKVSYRSQNFPQVPLHFVLGSNDTTQFLATTKSFKNFTHETLIYFKFEKNTPFPLAYLLDVPSSEKVHEALENLFLPPHFTYRFHYLHVKFDPQTDQVTLFNDMDQQLSVTLPRSTFRMCMCMCTIFNDIFESIINNLRHA